MPWSKILGFVGQLGSGIISAIGGALTLVNNMMAFGFRTAMQYHEEGIAFARTMGMSAKEAVAYTQVLTDRATTLGQKYGIAADAIKEIQKNIVDATGKQYMLNQEEAERMIQINKLVGAETNKAFTEEIVNHLGGQLSVAQSAVSKAYATAAKSGLSAAKFSEKVAKNLTLANKLTFRDGVNGIIKMTSLSEKLGFNLQSVSGVADKFMELDQAISTSAQLQMLGGPAAAFGANPLTMAYEANYDMEALTERMTNMLSGYATFNKATGVADVNGMNRQFVYEISKAMGISMDEAMSIAKKQAEIKYKEGAYGRELGNISKENRDAVLNRSYIDTETGHLMINDIKGEKHDITENGLDETIIEELKKFDNMSEKEIMEKQSQTLISINEKIEGIWTSLGGQLADVFNKHMPKIQKFVDGIGTSLNNAMPKITEALSELMDDILKPENLDKIQEYFPKLADNVATFLASGIDFFREAIDFLSDIKDKGEGIIAAITGWGFYKSFKNFFKDASAPKAPTPRTNPSGANPKPSRTPSGGATPPNTNTNTVRRGKHTWTKDPNRGWVRDDGKTPSKTREVKDLNRQLKDANKAKSASSTSSTSPSSTETTSGGAKPKVKGGLVKSGLKAGAKGSWLSILMGGYEAYSSDREYDENEKKIIAENATDKETKRALAQAKKERNKGIGSGAGTAIGGVAGGAAGGALGGAIAGAAAGAAAGTVVPVVGNIVGAVVGLAVGMAGAYYGSKLGEEIADNIDTEISDEELKKIKEKAQKHAKGGIIGASPKQAMKSSVIGGIIGGNSYTGDNLLGAFNSAEMIVPVKEQGYLYDYIKNTLPQVVNNMNTTNTSTNNKFMPSSLLNQITNNGGVSSYSVNKPNTQNHAITSMMPTTVYGDNISNRANTQSHTITSMIPSSTIYGDTTNSYMNNVTSVLPKTAEVKSKPVVGEKAEYIYKPNGTETSNVNGNTITVKDFNINLSGTLRLDGGNVSKNIDMNALLNDYQFMNTLKEMIKTSINNDMNGGRFMNDLAAMRGQVSSSSIIGR